VLRFLSEDNTYNGRNCGAANRSNQVEEATRYLLHAMHLLGGNKRKSKNKSKNKSKTVPIKRRRMSAAGKARIAAAQKARWAKVRAAEKKAA
jgi:hypothetical protein